jgi:hypothetical protein
MPTAPSCTHPTPLFWYPRRDGNPSKRNSPQCGEFERSQFVRQYNSMDFERPWINAHNRMLGKCCRSKQFETSLEVFLRKSTDKNRFITKDWSLKQETDQWWFAKRAFQVHVWGAARGREHRQREMRCVARYVSKETRGVRRLGTAILPGCRCAHPTAT